MPYSHQNQNGQLNATHSSCLRVNRCTQFCQVFNNSKKSNSGGNSGVCCQELKLPLTVHMCNGSGEIGLQLRNPSMWSCGRKECDDRYLCNALGSKCEILAELRYPQYLVIFPLTSRHFCSLVGMLATYLAAISVVISDHSSFTAALNSSNVLHALALTLL